MKNCLYCGFPMHDNVQFCPKCGAPQPDGQPQQQMPPQYPNQPYNNPQNPYSQQSYNGYPQQPYYGNPQYPQYGAPQQPVINVHVGYPQQPNYGNQQNPQYGGNQMPNYGSYTQQNFDQSNNQPVGKKEKQKEEKKKTGCLTIGLWILFFPIMLWIYAIKKKQLVWYVIAAAVTVLCLISYLTTPKTNTNKRAALPTSTPFYDSGSDISTEDFNNSIEEINNFVAMLSESFSSTDTPIPMELSLAEIEAPTDTPVPTEVIYPTDTSTPVEIPAFENTGGVDPDLKAYLDSYEAFWDEYIAFLQNYDSSDFSQLTRYLSFLQKLEDFERKSEIYDSKKSEMSQADSIYYDTVMLRVANKMIMASSYQY